MLTLTEGKKYDIREVSQWGIVVDNNDPLKLQRVKLRLDSYPENMTDEQLPWASPLKSTFQGGGNEVYGTISIPEIGSIVRVVHMYDQYSPCYVDVLQSTSQNNLVIDELTDYPRIYGAQDSNKNYYRIELVKKLMKVLMDSEIQVNQFGDVKIKLGGNLHLKCDNLLLESGSVQITSGQINTNSNITAQKVEANTVNTKSLSADDANISGAFKGTLSGTAFFATYAGKTPSTQPEPAMVDVDIPTPLAPTIDFDSK